jgi:hypothetical protein
VHTFTASEALVKGILLAALVEVVPVWTSWATPDSCSTYLAGRGGKTTGAVVCYAMDALTVARWRLLMTKTF